MVLANFGFRVSFFFFFFFALQLAAYNMSGDLSPSFLGLESLHVFITGAAGGIGQRAVQEFLGRCRSHVLPFETPDVLRKLDQQS